MRVVRVILIDFLNSITRGDRILSIELSYNVAGGIYIIKKFESRRPIEIGLFNFILGSTSNYSRTNNLFDLIVLIDIDIYR